MVASHVLYTFEEHMWNRLPEIEKHSKDGGKILKEFMVFCKSYNFALERFAQDINKSHEILAKNVEKLQSGSRIMKRFQGAQ